MPLDARNAFSWKAVVFHSLAGLTLAVFLMAPLAALQPFEWGAWRLTSVSILMMYLGGALSAVTIIFGAMMGGTLGIERISRPAFAVTVGGLVLAAAGIPGTLFADSPLLSLAGTYQSGLGVLWFIHFALAALLIGMLSGGAWLICLDVAMAVSLVCICAGRIADMLTPGQVLMLPGGDSYAYLAAAGIAFSFADGGVSRHSGKVIFFVASVLMLVSGNLTAIGATLLLGVIALLMRYRVGLRSSLLIFQRPFPALVILMVSVIGPPGLLFTLPIDLLPESLQSRIHIHELSFAVLWSADLLQWLFGLGWGHIQAAYYANLLEAEYPIYLQEWDFLWRDIFHSHNAAIEALLASGLVGFTVYFTVFWFAVRFAARTNRAALWFLLMFYLLMASVWFEYSFVLPFLAIAAVRCTSRPGKRVSSSEDERVVGIASPVRYVGIGVAGFIFVAVLIRMALFESAVADYKFDTLIDKPEVSVRLDSFPTDPRGTRFVESIVLRELWRKRESLLVSQNWADDSRLALELLERARTLLSEVDGAPMLLVGLSVLNDLAYSDEARNVDFARISLPLWEKLVRRHWDLAPRRFDISVGYLEFLKQTGEIDQLRAITLERLQTAPDDPVAIYYAALASLHWNPAERNSKAMRSILHAIDLGLPVILPVDPQFELYLRSKFSN